MVDTSADSPQQTMLKRLLQSEAEAQERHRQAEERARQFRAETTSQVQQLLKNARAAATAEAQASAEQGQANLETAIQQLAAANQKQITAMRQQAEIHGPTAVDYVVDWVIGKRTQP